MCQHRYKRKIKKKKRGEVLGLKVFSDSLRSWAVRAGLGPTSFSSLFLLFFMLPLADSLGPCISAFSLSYYSVPLVSCGGSGAAALRSGPTCFVSLVTWYYL